MERWITNYICVFMKNMNVNLLLVFYAELWITKFLTFILMFGNKIERKVSFVPMEVLLFR